MTAGTPTSTGRRQELPPAQEDIVVLAHLLALLLECVPASVQNIRELGLLWVTIQIFELLRIRLRILEVALLVYNLLRIP